MRLEDDITCRQLVELVTDYVEGALSPAVVERFEEHLVICEGCTVHVEQMRETIRLVGVLREEDLEQEAADRLLAAFRGWSTES